MKGHYSDLCKKITKNSRVKIEILFCSFRYYFHDFPTTTFSSLYVHYKILKYTLHVIFQQRNATHFQYLLRSFVNFWWKNWNILKTVIVQRADQIQWTIMGYSLFSYDFTVLSLYGSVVFVVVVVPQWMHWFLCSNDPSPIKNVGLIWGDCSPKVFLGGKFYWWKFRGHF